MNLNQVHLAGNLTRDPQVRTLAGDRTVTDFGLAINRRWKNADGETKEEVTFIDCECWGRVAEVVGQYCLKGSGVYVGGRLKLDSWQDKQGQKRSRIKVLAETVQFLGKAPVKATAASAETGFDTDDQGAQAKPPAAAARREAVKSAKAGAARSTDDEPAF